MSNKAFDRSAFQATKVNHLKEEEEKVKDLVGFGDNDRITYLKLKKGKNKVRIYPAHPGTTSFCQPKTVHFLELESKNKDGEPVDDEGKLCKDSGKMVEIKRRPTFNSKVHGGFAEGVAPIDIIDEYIQRVFAKAHAEIQDDDQRKKYTSPMTFWKTGITGKTKWVIYADLYDENNIPQFGRLDLAPTVKDKLNEIAANQDGDGILAVDPFTDPDTGRVVFVTYDPDENDPKKKYTASIDFQKSTPLNDERLGLLMEQDSLEKLFKNSYTHKDFMNALEGLKRFDDKSVHALGALGFQGGYGIFAQEDFLDVCEKVAELFPFNEEEAADAGQTNSFVDGDQSASAQAPFKAQAPATLEEMNLDQLSNYIHTNGLDVTILPDDAPADVVIAIKDAEGASQGEVASQQEETATSTRRERGSRSSELG